MIHPGFIAILFFVSMWRWIYLSYLHPPIIDFLPKWQMNLPALLIRVYVFLLFSWFSWFDVPLEMRAEFARLAFFAWGAEEFVAFVIMLAFEAGYRQRNSTHGSD